jgi:MULE transposase domain
VIISSPFMMEVLANAEVVASDGTFKAKPVELQGRSTAAMAARSTAADNGTLGREKQKGWSQVYTLHPQVNGRFVPAAVAFIGRANTGVYLVLLSAISDWIRNNFGKRWRPKLFMTDFEAAIRSAVDRFFEGNLD